MLRPPDHTKAASPTSGINLCPPSPSTKSDRSTRPPPTPATRVLQILNDFLAFQAPVLVISYDSYRKYAAKINAVGSIGLLVCDEGHRLKNDKGSKVTCELRCTAPRP